MTHITLYISGMTCGGCINSIKRVLSALPGISQVDVSLEDANAQVKYDPVLTTPDAMRTAINDAGFSVGHNDAG